MTPPIVKIVNLMSAHKMGHKKTKALFYLKQIWQKVLLDLKYKSQICSTENGHIFLKKKNVKSKTIIENQAKHFKLLWKIIGLSFI